MFPKDCEHYSDYVPAKALYDLVKHNKRIDFIWRADVFCRAPRINFTQKNIYYTFYMHGGGAFEASYCLVITLTDIMIHHAYGTIDEAIACIKNFLEKIDFVL